MVIVSLEAEPTAFAVIGITPAEIQALLNDKLIEGTFDAPGGGQIRFGLTYADSETTIMETLCRHNIVTRSQVEEVAHASS